MGDTRRNRDLRTTGRIRGSTLAKARHYWGYELDLDPRLLRTDQQIRAEARRPDGEPSSTDRKPRLQPHRGSQECRRLGPDRFHADRFARRLESAGAEGLVVAA